MKLTYCVRPLILVMAMLAIISCSAPKDLVYKDFTKLSVEKMGFSSSAVRMDLIYNNPNSFGLQLKRTELDIYLDSTFLGHTSQEFQITIPRKSDFSLPIRVEVDMKNIFKNAWNTLINKEVLVTVTGRITIGKLNVFKSFPVKYEGKQTFSLF